VLSVLRIVAAFCFILHGTQKLFAFPTGNTTAAVWSLMGLAGLLETIGGTLLLFGLFTRPVAFLLSGEMAYAYFSAHMPTSVWPIVNRGESAVLFCFLWLYIASAGPGSWSLDAVRRHS